MFNAPLVLVVIAFLAVSAPAGAHEVGLSRGTYTLTGSDVAAEIVLAERDVLALDPELDDDENGRLSQPELDEGGPRLERLWVAEIGVYGDDAVCPGSLRVAEHTEGDAVRILADYRCPHAPRSVAIRLDVLRRLPPLHRQLATLVAGSARAEDTLTAERAALAVDVVAGPTARAAPGFFAMLLMGVEHILLGYDHLVFLLGLVLVGGKWRDLVWVVTAFTLAHSITLALAALGTWAPSPRIIEPAIALSIAYVGVENFFVSDAAKRWRITLPFGLIHGFGFAGALAELELPRSQVPVALLAFNLGVELGQLAVMALVVPLVLYLRKRERFRNEGVKALSAAIALAGIVWFVLRLAGR